MDERVIVRYIVERNYIIQPDIHLHMRRIQAAHNWAVNIIA